MIQRSFLRTLTAAVLTLCATFVVAQSGFAQPSSGDAGSFKYKADKISLTNNGVRLDGNAQITSPQLDVSAATIAFDFEKNQITAVRARNHVNIKITQAPKGGGVPTHLEATCDEADLNPPKRILELRGNVDGIYQVGSGARTTLAGTKAILTYVGGQPNIEIFGPVTLIVPPEPNANGGNAAAIGTVKVTSENLKFDQKTGEVRFVGNARAVSQDGANQFDVSAPEMVLTRGSDNTIDTLKTVGRTTVKIDLPPDPARPATVTGVSPAIPSVPVVPDAPDASTPAGTSGGNKIGKPTHVEVMADAATVNRKTNTMVFTGNVTGFYNLAPAGAQAQKYDFSGTTATIVYVPEAQATTEKPAGLKADIVGAKGKPVQVTTPSFNLDLGG